jgi:hypothetical protein
MMTMQQQNVSIHVVADRFSTETYIYSAVGPFSNIKGLTYYKDNEEDPYITMKDVWFIIIGF